MLEELERRLGLNTSPTVFFTSAVFIVAFVALSALFPGPIADGFGAAASDAEVFAAIRGATDKF